MINVHYISDIKSIQLLAVKKGYEVVQYFGLNINGIDKLPVCNRFDAIGGDVFFEDDGCLFQISIADCDITVYASSLEAIQKGVQKYLYLFNEDKESNIFIAKEDYGDYSFKKVMPGTLHINIIKELYPDIDIDILVQDYIESNESVLILLGEPGVGKTMFGRYLLTKIKDRRIALVREHEYFAKNAFWNNVQQHKIDLLILDDVDFSFEKDQANSNDVLSNILAFTDGIIKNNTKMIITTNNKISEINNALTRPGRCFDCIALSKLEFDYAKDVWMSVLNMSEASFDDFFKEKKQISQAELMNAFHHVQSSKQPRRYIKGDKVPTFAEKKLGF